MHRSSILIISAIGLLTLSAVEHRPFDFSKSPDPREAFWVDSVFDALTEAERLGQLFMLRACRQRILCTNNRWKT
ncbi:MAG: hypothetical protein IPK76_07450 [Lewinellaceae bacterium]|nr:hypothetical protein [Lewinellaceae bacterium]